MGGPIIPPVERAASGFDDAEVGCACEDVSSSVPGPVACRRVCARKRGCASKIESEWWLGRE